MHTLDGLIEGAGTSKEKEYAVGLQGSMDTGCLQMPDTLIGTLQLSTEVQTERKSEMQTEIQYTNVEQIQANQDARVTASNRKDRQLLQTEEQNQANKASMHVHTFENPEQITETEQPLIQLKNAMARVAAEENSSTTRKEDEGGPCWKIGFSNQLIE